MYIETTINITADILNKLTIVATMTGDSKRNIISSLLRHLADECEPKISPWKRVKYQDRGSREQWRRLHLVVRQDEYEFFLDLRKIFKQSLSRLVAYAVGEYLDKLIKKLKNGTDKYRYKNYMFSYLVVDGIPCWVFCWGIPRKIPRIPFNPALIN